MPANDPPPNPDPQTERDKALELDNLFAETNLVQRAKYGLFLEWCDATPDEWHSIKAQLHALDNSVAILKRIIAQ